ncbi:hypothetical protein ACJROX_07745 [Pseudalkalibacillus sp. A8]|uniref:hypothetical protein n=1 Tax=Pseudalkalibacillus sp. A8 TaxID=3382641 RepID=UPI0038B48385
MPSSKQEDYIVFEVENWQELEQTIKPVGYGILAYTMTTANTLKQSKELPEIFMKSKEEVALWRLMRRFSSQVKLQLDQTHLDLAKHIRSYEIKGIQLTVDHENDLLILTNKQYDKEVLPLSTIYSNPSGVFKTIVSLIKV